MIPWIICAVCTAMGTGTADDTRLHALFLGDRAYHHPADRLHDVWGEMARRGIVLDWEEELGAVTPELLARYDCVVMYANHPELSVVPPSFAQSLDDYIRSGGGFASLHCVSGCFMESPEWLDLIGARFQSHGAEVFQQTVVDDTHAITSGWIPFETWDETYVQEHTEDDRKLLTKRDEEPWCWVRQHGRGRIFYTASGHDHRTWRHPGWADHLERAIIWVSGDQAAKRHLNYAPIEFQYEAHPWVPNYEAHDPPMPYQLPSTPDQATAALLVSGGFQAQLFASEPLIVNPVAMDWDSSGRCWIIESPDYPNDVRPASGRDRISILEDRDNDGRADHKTVFAEGLNIPTGLLVVSDGVIVAEPPNLIHIMDTDGDDKADSRTVIGRGFGRWDTHAGPSNLQWGPDNAIWGAVGYSGFKSEDGPTFNSGLWRWDPAETHPEFLSQFTNNTWGIGLRDDGEIFGSTANGAPSFFVGAPKPALARFAPNHPGAAPVHDSAVIHPALEQLQQGDFMGEYTAAAGHEFATGTHVPDHWVDRTAFVCEPTAHLVGRMQTYPEGSGWRTRDCFNIVASTDEWFCPVQAEVGPDGAIWIADLAQFIILHNLPGNPERGLPEVVYGDGNAHLNPLRDSKHGRIYRLVGGPIDGTDLSEADVDELIAALSHPNRFWRTTARRLLVEGLYLEATDALLLLAQSPNDHAATEAIRTLHGLGLLGGQPALAMLGNVLRSGGRASRHAALALLPSTPTAARVLLESDALRHEDLITQRHALLAAARLPESPAIGTALAGVALNTHTDDDWIFTALGAGAAAHADAFVAAAAPLLGEPNKPVLIEFNGTFDHEGQAQTAGWQTMTWRGESTHDCVASGRDGSSCMTIQSDVGGDTSWTMNLKVEPSTRYRLEGWIRTENVTHDGDTHGALLVVHPGSHRSDCVTNTSDWTRVECTWTTSIDQTNAQVHCLFGGWGLSTGQAWFDDLTVESLGPARDLQSVVEAVQPHTDGRAGTREPRRIDLSGGVPEAGERIFTSNAIVACFRCHSLDGSSQGQGPDLSSVGDRLSEAEILESILDPNAAMADDWTSHVSAMPALGSFLSDAEVRDLVAFLRTQTASSTTPSLQK